MSHNIQFRPKARKTFNMPEIKVKITQGSTEVSNSSKELQSDDLTSLLSALLKAKEETNASLSKIVESLKDNKPARKTSNDDEDSCSDDDLDDVNKKQRT